MSDKMPEKIWVDCVSSFSPRVFKSDMPDSMPYTRTDIAERNARIAAIVEAAFPQLAAIELAVAQGFISCEYIDGTIQKQNGEPVKASDFLDNFLKDVKAAMEGERENILRALQIAAVAEEVLQKIDFALQHTVTGDPYMALRELEECHTKLKAAMEGEVQE